MKLLPKLLIVLLILVLLTINLLAFQNQQEMEDDVCYFYIEQAKEYYNKAKYQSNKELYNRYIQIANKYKFQYTECLKEGYINTGKKNTYKGYR